MKIYTRVEMQWDGSRFITTHIEGHEYDGPLARCCGASGAQQQIESSQQNFMNQVMQQGQQVFGNSSQVFGDLINSLAPTVAAGPSQEGFSAAEKANLDSQAITQAGVGYKNAKAAVGNAQAAQGGGNTGLTSGANIGTDDNLASSAAENTSNQLSQITEADYQTGRQNYDTAVGDLENSTNVFNSSANIDNAATNAGNAASNTANEISQQNNSWIQGVTGALGGIAGGVVSGGMSNLGKGVGFFGGSGGSSSGGTIDSSPTGVDTSYLNYV